MRTLGRGVASLAALALGAWLVPQPVCAREADGWMRGDTELVEKLARGVDGWEAREVARGDFHTGSSRFDGEWVFGTHVMAALGFGQLILEHPEMRARYLPSMRRALDHAVAAPSREFDHGAWGSDPLDTLGSNDQHHAAYLGYLNLALGLYRRIEPDSSLASLNDDVTSALSRRLESAPILLLRTYPDETYPVDNAAVIASIALRDRILGQVQRPVTKRALAALRDRYRDPVTGLLLQAVDPATGAASGAARGSGTCLASYFLTFADAKLSADLWQAARSRLGGTVLRFGAMREYPASEGRGDIDSGPVVFGWGVSATGFALGPSRAHHDADSFTSLYATAHLFGVPRDSAGARHYVTGGPLGDSILFAMLTARVE